MAIGKACIFLLAGISFAGCSRLQKSDSDGPYNLEGTELSLESILERDQFARGESITCTVRLRNDGWAGAWVSPLDVESLTFYASDTETNTQHTVEPVVSQKEPAKGEFWLESGDVLERSFLFTTLTDGPGDGAFTASYQLETWLSSEAPDYPVLFSEPVAYTVTGELRYERDARGVLLKEDAIELCRSESGIRETRYDAVLIRNEAGFLEWWVKTIPEDGSEPLAWFLNPYLPSIRAKAKPFPDSLKADPSYAVRMKGEAMAENPKSESGESNARAEDVRN